MFERLVGNAKRINIFVCSVILSDKTQIKNLGYPINPQNIGGYSHDIVKSSCIVMPSI